MGGTVESLLTSEILKSLGEGNATKGLFLILIFAVIWLEVRGMKKQFKTLNATIAESFAKGEVRFKNIENDIHSIKLDLDQLKPKQTLGGEHGISN